MRHKSIKPRIGKKVAAAILVATVAFTTGGVYSFAPQAVAAEHDDALFDSKHEAAWTKWDTLAGTNLPIVAPYAGPDHNETVTVTADHGATTSKPKYAMHLGSLAERAFYDILENRMNSAQDQSQWSLHEGDARTITFRFSEPVLNPLYRLNYGLTENGSGAPWYTRSWEDVRLAKVDGNPVDPGSVTANRVRPVALYGPYKNDWAKEGLTPGDIQVDPRKAFVEDPENPNRPKIVDGNSGFIGERILQVTGWVTELTFEVTPRAVILDNLGNKQNRTVHYAHGGFVMRMGIGAPLNDVGVRKTVNPTTAVDDDTLEWTVRVTNHKSYTRSLADGVEGYYLIDELPENVDPDSFKVVSKPATAHLVKKEGRKVYFKKVATGYELQLNPDETHAEVVGGDRTATPLNILAKGASEDYVFSAKIAAKEVCAPEEIVNNVRVVPAFYDVDKNNNTASARVTYKCVTPVNAETTAPQGEAQKSSDKAEGDAGKTVAEMFPNIPARTTYVLEGADPQGNVVLPGVGSYSITPDGVVTFTPLPDFSGVAPAATIVATTPGKGVYKATYTPTVTDKVVPVHAETVGVQGEVQTSADKKADPEVNGQVDAGKTRTEMFPHAPTGSTVAIEGANPQTGVKTVAGEGSYILNAENVVVFTPEKDFTGTATPINVVLTTPSKNTFTATYTATVLENAIVPVNATTTGVQGKAQKSSDQDDAADNGKTPGEMFPGAPKGSIFKLKDPATTNTTDQVVIQGQGTYQIDPATGEVTFTPEPKFTGAANPVTVILTTPGKNLPQKGQDAPKDYEATYTPTVLEAKIVTESATTVGEQDQNQKSNDKVEVDGDKGLEPNDMFPNYPSGSTFKLQGPKGEVTEVEVERQGTYTLDEQTGLVTFDPDPKFTGEAEPVTIVLTTPDGTKYAATYTPTVKEAALVPVNANTVGVQGEDQHSNDKGDADGGLEPNEMFPNFPYGSTFAIEGADPVTGVLVVPGEGTYAVDTQTGVVTFKPDPKFVGTADAATVKITTPGGETATATYTPSVAPAAIEPVNATTVGMQGEPQTSEDKNVPPAGSGPEVKRDAGKTPEEMFPHFPYGSTFALKGSDGTPTQSVKVDEVGTYTISDEGVVTFSPDPKFVGEAPAATIVLTLPENAGGTSYEATYAPTVLESPVVTHPVSTSGKQGVKQNAADKDAAEGDKGLTPEEMFPNFPYGSTFALKDPASGAKATTVTIDKQGTYEINPQTGELTFTPVDDFTGVATPVHVVLTTPGNADYETTYTPTVTEGDITPVNVTTVGVQGEPQKSTDTDDEGDEGKTLAEMFPNAPRNSKVTLLDADGHEVNALKVPGQGSYDISPDGVVTFTPAPDYTDPVTPVTIQLTTPSGTTVKATYTPVITKLTGMDAATTGVQGQPQTSADQDEADKGLTPEQMFPGLPAGSSFTLEGAASEGDNAGKVVVDGQGVYSIAENGVVTFTPEPKFTGPAKPVTITATTANGATVTATYTPTVTEATITPVPMTSIGVQGQVQEWPGVDKAFPNAPANSTLKLKDPVSGNPVDKVIVPGEGTYTVDPATGKVTFAPEPHFEGQAKSPVTVVLTTPNGTTVETTYTPTVNAIQTVNSTSEGVKGEKQNSDPGSFMFPNGPANPTYSLEGANPEGKLVVENVGEYTIDPATGVVTFTPAPEYVGTPAAIKVQANGKDGQTAFATYTPTVTEKSADPADSGDNPQDQPKDEPFVAKTTGVKGETQKSTDTDEGDKGLTPAEMFPDVPEGTKYTLLEDGTNKTGNEITIDGEGTYTINPDTGVVTFTPESNFVGPAKGILIQATTPDGQPVLRPDGSEMVGKYVPTVTDKPADQPGEKPDNNAGNGSNNDANTGNGSGDSNGTGSSNEGNTGGNGDGSNTDTPGTNGGTTGGNGSGNGSGNGGSTAGNASGNGGDTSDNATPDTNAGNAGDNPSGTTSAPGKTTAPSHNAKATALAATGATAGIAGSLVALFAVAGASLVTLRRRNGQR